jgi:hypothetical protein
LPSDDGEFYQFCYVTSYGNIRGASTPFQFRRPSCAAIVEIADSATDMLIIQSETVRLEESLTQTMTDNKQLAQVWHYG